MPGLAVQLDAYALLGGGVSRYQRADGSGLGAGFEVRRLLPTFAGTLGKKISYVALLELGLSNSAGPGQTFAFRGGAAFAWVNYEIFKGLAIRFGQMPLPVALELVRPPFQWDFMEPARASGLAYPNLGSDAGVMIFGTPGSLSYGVGIYNGEGRNRTSVDSQFDAMGIASYAINQDGDTRVRFGAGGRYGRIDPRSSWGLPSPIGLATDRGYSFWAPVYAVPDAGAFIAGQPAPAPAIVQVLTSNQQRVVSAHVLGELGGRVTVQLEGFRYDLDRREAFANALNVENTLRAGELTGYSYYVTVGGWILNPTKVLRNQRFNLGALKLGPPPRQEPDKHSLEVLVRWEQLFLDYDSNSRSGPFLTPGLLDLYTTTLRADSIQAQVVYWLSSHFKASAQWNMFVFPGDPVGDGRRVDNQALAPGAVIPGERGTRLPSDLPPLTNSVNNATFFQPYAPGARVLHEVAFRVQLRF